MIRSHLSRVVLAAMCVTSFLLVQSQAQAVTRTWTGSGDGTSWTDAGNWDGGVTVPQSGQDLDLTTGVKTVNLNGLAPPSGTLGEPIVRGGNILNVGVGGTLKAGDIEFTANTSDPLVTGSSLYRAEINTSGGAVVTLGNNGMGFFDGPGAMHAVIGSSTWTASSYNYFGRYQSSETTSHLLEIQSGADMTSTGALILGAYLSGPGPYAPTIVQQTGGLVTAPALSFGENSGYAAGDGGYYYLSGGTLKLTNDPIDDGSAPIQQHAFGGSGIDPAYKLFEISGTGKLVVADDYISDLTVGGFVTPGSGGALAYNDLGNGTIEIFFQESGGAVPEPSTYALGLIGLAGLGLITWRRHRVAD
ncbi:MAG: PEP-CTERM sorting domain-containing protein [Planctomycetia bacterium]|nr:PEP-CTERM sorting domain-containing protein [Planctomycetia bacterium]